MVKVVPAGAGTLCTQIDAVVKVDDALDDRKAEAGRALAAGRLGGEALEAPEQPRHVLRRQARPLVGDADDGASVLLRPTPTSMRPPIGLYLMALLRRLSIASRMRSGSQHRRRAPAAPRPSITCSLRAGERLVRLARPRSTRATMSTGSGADRDVDGRRPSRRRSGCRPSRSGAWRRSRMCSIWAFDASPATLRRCRPSPSASRCGRESRRADSCRSCATVPRTSLLKALARCSRVHLRAPAAHWPRSARAVRWRTRSSRRALACCSCS